jgi:hypothetical protein
MLLHGTALPAFPRSTLPTVRSRGNDDCDNCRGLVWFAQPQPSRVHRRLVLLAYKLPPEPSTPRIALWRPLRRLGDAQPIARPADSRTREQLEWLDRSFGRAGGICTGLPRERPLKLHTMARHFGGGG